MIGQEDTLYLLSTDAGFGFVARISDMNTRNKSGKAVLTAKNVGVLPPQRIEVLEDSWIAAITTTGRLLIFSIDELAQLARGKGVKVLNITTTKYKSGEEKLADVAVFKRGDQLRITAGRQHMNLKSSDMDNYIGSRAQRGRMLPRGYKNAEKIQADNVR